MIQKLRVKIKYLDLMKLRNFPRNFQFKFIEPQLDVCREDKTTLKKARKTNNSLSKNEKNGQEQQQPQRCQKIWLKYYEYYIQISAF